MKLKKPSFKTVRLFGLGTLIFAMCAGFAIAAIEGYNLDQMQTSLQNTKEKIVAYVNETDTTISEKDEAIASLTTQLEAVKAEKDEALFDLNRANGIIDDLEREIDDLETQILMLEVEGEEDAELIKQLQQEVEDKAQTIAEQEATITELQGTVADKEATITQLNNSITELNNANSSLEADNAALKALVEQANREAQEFENEITDILEGEQEGEQATE